MARIKIDLPEEWQFSTEITVRVSDLNYGNHLGNDRFLSYAQEARMRYFNSLGYSELNFGGVSLIQADAVVVFKGEGHLGDQVKVDLSLVKVGGSSFQVYYKFTNLTKGKLMAEISTAIVCFDYEKGKPVPIPETILESGLFLE